MLYDRQWDAGTQRKLKKIVEVNELILFQWCDLHYWDCVFKKLINYNYPIMHQLEVNIKTSDICKIRKPVLEMTLI
jgi:hypothetical protein